LSGDTSDLSETTESVYDGLRRQIFDLDPIGVGLTGAGQPGGVWGVVFELGMPATTVTVIALADGTTSLYTTGGFGIIGGGAHPAVVVANRKLREAVAAQLPAFRPDPGTTVPGPDDVRVRALTTDGRRVADAAQADLLDGTHPLSDLFFAGHAVVTRLREIHDAAEGDPNS
jgi:hypothetical protein